MKQAAFLNLTTLEAFYGGRAGGGKTDGLLMAALQYVDVPGYSAILFRRTSVQLMKPESIMGRAKDWLLGQSGVRWNESKKLFSFETGGRPATLVFSHMEAEENKRDHDGAEYQFIGWEELTHFTETQYRYLFSRLRRLRTASDVPLRVRGGSNPGNIGHAWVKKRFVTGGWSHGRPFIPAAATDNPYLDWGSYQASLAELTGVDRARLEHGDWDATGEGALFIRSAFRIIPERPRGASIRWVRYWDFAGTEVRRRARSEAAANDPDWTAGALVGLTERGQWIIADMRRIQGRPAAVEALVKQTAVMDRDGVAIRIEQEPGSAGLHVIDTYQRGVLVGRDVAGIRSTGDKVTRAKPLAAAAEAGNVALVEGAWNEDFLNEIEAFPIAGHDDQVDAVSGAMAELRQPMGGIRGLV